MVRAAFGNNNVDTCARVCHSPTGYGLKQTFGDSAGTQDFQSVDEADVIVVIGANPTDGHPVFASRMKQRLRQGAKLIVIDPRRIDLVRSPHIEADHHLQLAPGTNVAVVNAMAHVVVTEGLVDEAFVGRPVRGLRRVGGVHRARRRTARRPSRRSPACRPRSCAPPPGSTRRRQRRDLLRPRRHRAQPGLDDGHGHGEPRDGDRQHRPRRRRRQPAARPEQRAGLLRHGLVPARAARLPARLRRRGPRRLREAVGHARSGRAGPADPEHVRRRDRRHVPGAVRPGRGHRPVRPEHPARARPRSRRWSSSSCRTCSSTRPPSSPTCSCPARRSWRRTAPSPTPSAGSTGSAR